MINSDVLSVVERRVVQDLEDRREAFFREVENLWGEMSLNGVLLSGMTVARTFGAIGNEFRVRASLIWHAFARAFDTTGLILNDTVASEVKQRLAHMLETSSADLLERYQRAADLMPGSARPKSFDNLKSAAVERINTEIDYAVLRHSIRTESAPNVVTIYQSYGIVQTGTGASASFIINLGDEERLEIERALEAVEQALNQAASLGKAEHEQALELVTDVKSELQRAEPNGFRIRGALQGLATAIQTIAAAPQAYQLLKGAAALLGLQLP